MKRLRVRLHSAKRHLQSPEAHIAERTGHGLNPASPTNSWVFSVPYAAGLEIGESGIGGGLGILQFAFG